MPLHFVRILPPGTVASDLGINLPRLSLRMHSADFNGLPILSSDTLNDITALALLNLFSVGSISERDGTVLDASAAVNYTGSPHRNPDGRCVLLSTLDFGQAGTQNGL